MGGEQHRIIARAVAKAVGLENRKILVLASAYPDLLHREASPEFGKLEENGIYDPKDSFPSKHHGAQAGARIGDCLTLARRHHLNGDAAKRDKWLGVALHFIADAKSPYGGADVEKHKEFERLCGVYATPERFEGTKTAEKIEPHDVVNHICASYPASTWGRSKSSRRNRRRQKRATSTGLQCPHCGKELVVRHGRRGRFLGCSGYPKCRFTCGSSSRDIAELKRVAQGERRKMQAQTSNHFSLTPVAVQQWLREVYSHSVHAAQAVYAPSCYPLSEERAEQASREAQAKLQKIQEDLERDKDVHMQQRLVRAEADNIISALAEKSERQKRSIEARLAELDNRDVVERTVISKLKLIQLWISRLLSCITRQKQRLLKVKENVELQYRKDVQKVDAQTQQRVRAILAPYDKSTAAVQQEYRRRMQNIAHDTPAWYSPPDRLKDTNVVVPGDLGEWLRGLFQD